ncbi:hypothetical protein CERSUDRAFT_116657 [Gelatoporia subvermispora B]|uniref:NAD-P-binding protein n=1 Tax=Ceriporiopsis subvermispora (strain B) TaxID=914234 RepID=M2PGP1_CERS8|nr:hypothetical protein CERSUDRAFT_116657 [Gelatoporia subvermispora B]
MPAPKVWFITGASTGLGRAMTELVLKNGDIAVATLRKPEALAGLSAQYASDRLLVLKLDVTSRDEIAAAFARTKETFGRADIVFNNAGYGVATEVEYAYEHDQLVRDVFEVNFWGAAHMTQAAIKFFREVNGPSIGGHLLQNSSMFAIESMPCVGYYCSTKFALEGLSEALSKELDPSWNIKVTIIKAGFLATDIHARADFIDALPAYAQSPAASARENLYSYAKNPIGGDPEKAVEAFYRLTRLPDPPLHFILGKDAIELIKRKIATLTLAMDSYASWSEGLERTGNPEEESRVSE